MPDHPHHDEHFPDEAEAARKQHRDEEEDDEEPDMSKLTARYNLEKPPLAGGAPRPWFNWLGYFKFMPKGWELHERSWLWLTLWSILLLLVLGGLTLWLASWLFDYYFGLAENL